jgi:hypothetical protein
MWQRVSPNRKGLTMRAFLRTVSVIVVTVATMACQAWAEESAVSLDKLPKAVVESIRKKFPTAELVEATQEKDDGDVEYEVTVKVAGKTIDVSLEADGKIEGYEKEIDITELPAAVIATLDKTYPKAIKKSAEVVFEIEGGKDELEFYEVQLETAGKKTIEAKIKADGTLITDKDEEKKSAVVSM